ncbi:hypothetical protein HZ326_29882 [Fusarium oxysporum f. sp. albedinis]|nr:hypothetical protein HZ326_29882 [Fusarium oxysporum f. sp. albedinis]
MLSMAVSITVNRRDRRSADPGTIRLYSREAEYFGVVDVLKYKARPSLPSSSRPSSRPDKAHCGVPYTVTASVKRADGTSILTTAIQKLPGQIRFHWNPSLHTDNTVVLNAAVA